MTNLDAAGKMNLREKLDGLRNDAKDWYAGTRDVSLEDLAAVEALLDVALAANAVNTAQDWRSREVDEEDLCEALRKLNEVMK